MSGKNRFIDTAFWDDEWIVNLDPSEKLLYIYFLTNPLTNISGIYKLTEKRICFDTGFNENTIRYIFQKFEKARKVYRYGEYVILKSWCKHQHWKESERIKQGIIYCLDEVPDDVLVFAYKIGFSFDLSFVLKKRGVALDSMPVEDKDTAQGNEEREETNAQRKPLIEREPKNDIETVEKAYLENYKKLHDEGVLPSDKPIINWGASRRLTKDCVEKYGLEVVVNAVKKSATNAFCVKKGYSLTTILSAGVLSELINGGADPPKKAAHVDLSGKYDMSDMLEV